MVTRVLLLVGLCGVLAGCSLNGHATADTAGGPTRVHPDPAAAKVVAGMSLPSGSAPLQDVSCFRIPASAGNRYKPEVGCMAKRHGDWMPAVLVFSVRPDGTIVPACSPIKRVRRTNPFCGTG